jgi:hypothetical protein
MVPQHFHRVPVRLRVLSPRLQRDKPSRGAAQGVALFPRGCGHPSNVAWIHYSSAAVMFVVLAFFCYDFYRTATAKGHWQARARGAIYVVCGIAILAEIAATACDAAFGILTHLIPQFTFYGEATGLIAFGVSWLTASRVRPIITSENGAFRLSRRIILTEATTGSGTATDRAMHQWRSHRMKATLRVDAMAGLVVASIAYFAGSSGIAAAAQSITASNVGSDIVVYRITEPIVTAAAIAYPSVVFRGGDSVTISAGGCAQTGGHGLTWKRYVDPSGPNADKWYHGLIQLPGFPMTRIQEVIGQTLTIPANASPLSLRLGYEDNVYGDNGYGGRNTGTSDQCKDVGNAWLVLVAHHPKPTSKTVVTPIASVPGINGLPILTTDFHNAPFDTTSPEWSSGICDHHTWLQHTEPPFEWTQVYNTKDELEVDAVGLSGFALFPNGPGDVGPAGISGDDMPFTHPFGKVDWETMIAPDPAFTNILAPSNTGARANATTPPNAEYVDANQRAAQLGLTVPHGVQGMETDQGLIPLSYRAREGDRVAVLGRWIVDCGHADFHTEIHPPLLFARAWAIASGANPDAPTSGPATVTFMRIIGRPYLEGQTFGDGALFPHLYHEIEKYFTVVLSTRLQAHPQIFPKPFSGIQAFSFVAQAPVLPPTSTVVSQAPVLLTTFHFTVRTGVAVQVTRESSSSVRVRIVMNSTSYKPAALPLRSNWDVSFTELSKNHEAYEKINEFLEAALPDPLTNLQTVLHSSIRTDQYADPIPASIHDGEITQVTVDNLGGSQFSVDDSQPFPIYGWLSLEWQDRGPPASGN